MLFAVVQTAAVSCSQFCQNDERVLSFPSKALHADRILKSFLISSLPLVIRKDSCQGCAYVCEGIRGHFAMCLLTSPSGTNSHSTNPDWPLFRGRFSQRARSARPRLLLRATPFPGLWPSGRQNWFQPFGLAGGFLGAGAKRDGKVEKRQSGKGPEGLPTFQPVLKHVSVGPTSILTRWPRAPLMPGTHVAYLMRYFRVCFHWWDMLKT